MDNTKAFLKKHNFIPSKKMGQNFLTNPIVIDDICQKIPDLSKFDCIVEIGPGLGAITQYLVTTGKPLICIELDKRLWANLKNKFNKIPNLQLINDDFLELNLSTILNSYSDAIVVANIPYSITSPIIMKCLLCNKIKSLYIMVQKEVADKWVYSQTSNRNATTNIINYYFDIQKIMTIKNIHFTPTPKVDSSMVLLNRKTSESYDAAFYNFMKPFFLSKRKKLLNNLPPSISKQKILPLLLKLGFDENVRAEQLHYNDWLTIYKELK